MDWKKAPEAMMKVHATREALNADMATVSHEEFFAALYADKRDIMPSNESREYTVWRVVRTREVWGITLPGWGNPGDEKVYMIRREYTKEGANA